MVYSYNGYYVRLSTGRQGFNSPIHRHNIIINLAVAQSVGHSLWERDDAGSSPVS